MATAYVASHFFRASNVTIGLDLMRDLTIGPEALGVLTGAFGFAAMQIPCGLLLRSLRAAVHRIAGNRNVATDRALPEMSAPNIAKPLARAINIYRSMTRHDLDMRTQRDLARHIKQVAEQGTHDPGRLTVHGLSYLRARERKLKERKE